MTTSGTTTFDLDFLEAIEEAYERCGLESRSGYDLRSARRSINLMQLEWANRGINLWTVEERVEPLVYNQAEYVLDADIVDIIEGMVRVPNTSQETRYQLTRVSVATFATRTNPTINGRPTQFYVNRQIDGPHVNIWPLPDNSGTYQFYYWVLRRIDDAGAYTNTGDFPFRFLPVFIAGLAYYISQKKRLDDPQLIDRLGGEYEKQWANAADEDRDKSALTITPRPDSYRVV